MSLNTDPKTGYVRLTYRDARTCLLIERTFASIQGTVREIIDSQPQQVGVGLTRFGASVFASRGSLARAVVAQYRHMRALEAARREIQRRAAGTFTMRKPSPAPSDALLPREFVERRQIAMRA
jgi:hypothetical protein